MLVFVCVCVCWFLCFITCYVLHPEEIAFMYVIIIVVIITIIIIVKVTISSSRESTCIVQNSDRHSKSWDMQVVKVCLIMFFRI